MSDRTEHLRLKSLTCQCRDYVFGSHAYEVMLPIPEHMAHERERRVRDGREGIGLTLCIDWCIVPEIRELWRLGIRTTGCCCGHNILRPFIGVEEADIPRMKELGYVVQTNPNRPGAEDTFDALSIVSTMAAA